jgi:hypothetical protein
VTVEYRKNNVDIDRLTSEDIIPLRVREFRYLLRAENHPLRTLKG